MGRTTTFTPDTATEILEGLAKGDSLRKICKSENLPAESTVRGWVVDDVQGFAAQYARARDIGLDAKADELIEVAATTVEGQKTRSTPLGLEVTTGDTVDRSRLHVDALKWYLSKLAPKRYGDKLELNGDLKVEMSVVDRIRASRKRVGGQ